MGRPAKHGGWAAQRALTNGEPFTKLAAETQMGVLQEIEQEGAVKVFSERMSRLITVGDLFWGAFLAAADQKDTKAMETYGVKVLWAYPAAMRAWGELRKAEAQKVVDVKKLLKELRGDGDSA